EHARHGRDFGADAVELADHVPGKGGMFGGKFLLLLCSGEYADAERLGEIEPATGARAVVLLEVFARDLPGNGEAEDRLRRIDAVAARKGDAGIRAGHAPALHHLPGHFRRQYFHRPAENGDGHDGPAAHGVDVADGIGGGDAAEVERIVRNGHEEVGGAEDDLAVADVVGGGVVLAAVADQQARIGPGCGFAGERAAHLAGAEDCIQNARRYLAAAPGAVAVFSQFVLLLGHANSPVVSRNYRCII